MMKSLLKAIAFTATPLKSIIDFFKTDYVKDVAISYFAYFIFIPLICTFLIIFCSILGMDSISTLSEFYIDYAYAGDVVGIESWRIHVVVFLLIALGTGANYLAKPNR